MSEEVNNDGHLRKYLLGELSEAEQQTLEERLLTETELFDLLQVAEDELVDDHLSGGLSASERGRFDGFFLSTPERRRKLNFAMALRIYVTAEGAAEAPAAEAQTVKPSPRISAGRSSVIGQATWWNRAFSSPYLRMAASAVIVLGLGLGIWRIFLNQPKVSNGIASLREAYRDQRPTEARITELNYAPPPPTTRGPERDKFDYVALDRAKALIQLEANEHPSAQSYHDLGRLYLADRDFDKAIDQFEKALKLDERNAQLHSDYGAALLEIGKAHRLKDEPGKGFEEFAKSLEHLNKALERDGSLLQALFNRALLYEYMSLPLQAEDGWNKYLEKDPNSKWADEARQHLKCLAEKKVARLQREGELLSEFIAAYQSRSDDRAFELMSENTEAITGELVWWQLLGAYLDLSSKGESDAAKQYFEGLSYAGRLQEERVGDQFVSELARFYGSSTSESQAFLARAHALINQAHALLAKSETDRAFELYGEAKNIFDKAGDQSESRFADYYLGYSLYRKSEFEKSLSVLSQVAEYGRAKDYLWLRGCALTMIANISGELDRFSASLASYDESLEISKKIHDEYGTQKNLTSLAYGYKNLGNRRESLSYMHQCLERAGACWPGTRQMYRNFDTAAGILNTFGYYEAASEYEKAALQLALDSKDPGLEHLSYTQLAAINSKLQDYEEALRCGERSYEVAKGMSDERTRLSPLALSSLELGHIYRHKQNYGKATACYDDAIRLCTDTGLFAYLYEAHKGMLLCHIAQDNDPLAEEELKIVLSLFEEHRSKIKEEKNKNSFFDVEQYVYDIAIDFEYSRKHNGQKAFEYSEVSRARSLFDLMRGGVELASKHSLDRRGHPFSEPVMLDGIQNTMPKRAQILQYSVLDDKLLIWVVSKDDFKVKEQRITAESLTHRVLDYWELLSNPSRNETQESRLKAIELYEVLIKPVEKLLDRESQICVVPDKALNFLPFNALISQDTHQYLVEDHLLSFAPSANTFLFSSNAARERAGTKDERVLTVGDPRFDRNTFQGLSDLSSSGKEAEQISRLYGSKCSLVGEDARKARIISEMPNADVIHFATHYVVDENSPMLSKLLLAVDSNENASGRSSEGFLQAEDIYRAHLPRTRLVVLSACRTGVEHYYKGEGMIGMSRTFLAAGVPLVIASLWPVASEPTADLMVAFHKYRKSNVGVSSAVALRQAQLHMIRDPQHQYDRPYYWAPFITIGGYADF